MPGTWRDVFRALRLVFRSRVMALGIVCEAVACGVAVSSIFVASALLPNVALALATLGAAFVAGRVAVDYHGRGLNGQQGADVEGLLSAAGLSDVQRRGVVEEILSRGLTVLQVKDLMSQNVLTDVGEVLFAMQALCEARRLLEQHGDCGYVVVLHPTAWGNVSLEVVAPPHGGICYRKHRGFRENGCDLYDVSRRLHRAFHFPAYLWRDPASKVLCHTDPSARDSLDGAEVLTFSMEDCIPKWRVPSSGDWVLHYDAEDRTAWVQAVDHMQRPRGITG